jgi:hypothetical protein
MGIIHTPIGILRRRMKLLHKLLPERVNSGTLGSIASYGLIPQLPSEYRESLPIPLQKVPIVWLAERMNTMDGIIFTIETDKLDRVKLHKLDWDDVNWWVYEGIIPPEAIVRGNEVKEEL